MNSQHFNTLKGRPGGSAPHSGGPGVRGSSTTSTADELLAKFWDGLSLFVRAAVKEINHANNLKPNKFPKPPFLVFEK